MEGENIQMVLVIWIYFLHSQLKLDLEVSFKALNISLFYKILLILSLGQEIKIFLTLPFFKIFMWIFSFFPTFVNPLFIKRSYYILGTYLSRVYGILITFVLIFLLFLKFTYHMSLCPLTFLSPSPPLFCLFPLYFLFKIMVSVLFPFNCCHIYTKWSSMK